LLFADGDQEFEADDILKMLSCDVDLISMAFARKAINWKRIHNAVRAGATAEQLPAIANTINHIDPLQLNGMDVDKPVEVDRADCGLLLIKRIVFKRIIDSRPELKYDHGYCFFDSGLAN